MEWAVTRAAHWPARPLYNASPQPLAPPAPQHRAQAAAQSLPDDPDATLHDDALDAIRTLLDALDQANATLYALNTREPGAIERGMGTTVTGLWQPPASALLVAFQVGDSRLYRYRDGALLQLSRDQTLYQQALELGNIDRLPPRNVLLQALGPLPVGGAGGGDPSAVRRAIAICSAATGYMAKCRIMRSKRCWQR